jgi:hypothetical protein
VANAIMVSFGIIKFFCGKNRQNRRNMLSTGTDVKIIGSLEFVKRKFYTFEQGYLASFEHIPTINNNVLLNYDHEKNYSNISFDFASTPRF